MRADPQHEKYATELPVTLVSPNWMRRRQQVVAEFLRRYNGRISIEEDHNFECSSQSNSAAVRPNWVFHRIQLAVQEYSQKADRQLTGRLRPFASDC
jgi:hypothetical protein